MDTIRDAIAKENPKMGTDPKTTLMGSAVKRKRLSDITNIVSSSRVATSRSQFRENTKEIACGITKECVAQLIEENATLLKAIGERNKIIELSSMELQKLRFTLEKATQQNRTLTQTNYQMLTELTSSKERLKVLQHELGCTVAVLKFKISALDEKEKLIKELSEKTRVAQNYKCPNVTTGVSLSHSINTSTWIPDTERTLRSKTLGFATSTHHQAKEKPKDESHEKIRAEEERHRCSEDASDVTRPHALDSNVACEPNKKRVLRSQSFGSVATMTHQVKTRETDAIRKSSRRRSKNQASQSIESKDSLYDILDADIPACSMISELPNENLPDKDKASTSVNHITKATENNNRRKSSRSRSENLASQAIESEDSLYEILDSKIPACSIISELPNENLPDKDTASASLNHTTKATEKDNRRKSSRSRSENLASQSIEYEDGLYEILVAKIPACSIINELPNENLPDNDKASASVNHTTKATEKDNRRKSSRRRSENLTSEPRESKTDLHEIIYVEIPACPVISEPMNEDCPVESESSVILTHKVEAEEVAKRGRKSSRRRPDNNLKSESSECNDQFPETVDLKKPALEPVAEPQIETSLPSHSNAAPEHKEVKAGKDHRASSQCEGQESRRTSVGRPSRRAAEKVSSYKEVPLKCKMRRPE